MANAQLEVNLNNETIRYDKEPKYLGNTLDRYLTFKSNLEKLSEKPKSRVNIMHKIAGTNWGANAHTLKTRAALK